MTSINPLFKWRELPGPWKDEPDRQLWIDEKTKLACLARRNPILGNWCGYVGVPETHPLYRKSYNDESYHDLAVHGGITFSKECDGDPDEGICHPAADDDKTWWIGFDCGHSGDLVPSLMEIPHFLTNFLMNGEYRDLEYVTEECESLAAQLARMK